MRRLINRKAKVKQENKTAGEGRKKLRQGQVAIGVHSRQRTTGADWGTLKKKRRKINQ